LYFRAKKSGGARPKKALDRCQPHFQIRSVATMSVRIGRFAKSEQREHWQANWKLVSGSGPSTGGVVGLLAGVMGISSPDKFVRF